MILMDALVIPTVSLFSRCLLNCSYIFDDNVIDVGLGLAFFSSLMTVLGPLNIWHLDY
jgi:hypothetical protein